MTVWPMPDLPELNPVIHGRLRLALLSLLSGVEEAEFTWLRASTASTDGNLGAQLLKLEEAGYVTVEKKFVLRKPRTLYRLTETGRQALTEYVRALKQLLGSAIDA
ncbi:MAG: winged helix-turn-helix domain-containing protein [Candidatus Acidiferrales bacterium]